MLNFVLSTYFVLNTQSKTHILNGLYLVRHLTCGTVVLHEFHGRQDFGTLSGFRDAQVV